MASQGKIFVYCERGFDPGFLAEPTNAVTNAAFVIAGLAAIGLLRRLPSEQRHIVHWLLCLLVIAIGVGSFLFHTFATRWAALADVLPIALFMLLYLGTACVFFLQAGLWLTALFLAGFVGLLSAAGGLCGEAGLCLNGSEGYLPALVALLGIGTWLAAKRHPAAPSILAAGLVFAVSITLRSLDRAMCEVLTVGEYTLGSHFLWHLLNAVTLYLLLRAAITYRPKVSLRGVGEAY